MGVLAKERHEIFAQHMAAGKTATESMIAAGYKKRSAAQHSDRLVKIGEVQARIAEIQAEILNAQLVDATKLHRRWSEMFEADIADIMTETGAFKPLKEWPKVWRQMLSAVDVKELFERSKDGGDASWDKIGEVIKLKFVGVKELGELIGKHKAVDAFVQQKQSTELHLHVHQEVTQRLQSALQREQAIAIEAHVED